MTTAGLIYEVYTGTALRIEKALVSMDKLMHMQTDWDIVKQWELAGEIHVLAYRSMQKPKTQGGLF